MNALAEARGQRETEMDYNSLMNYLTTLGLLYGWLLIAAAVFAIGERICHSVFKRQPAAVPAKDGANG